MPVDTSSYPKFQQTDFLDRAQKFQTLERGSIALGQDKLKQINDQFSIMNAELATLANDPSITKQQAASRLQTLSKTFNLKPEITAHMMNELNTAPSVKAFAENALVRGQATQEKVNFLYGQNNVYSQGQQDYPVVTSPKFGMRQVGQPIQRQAPPNTEIVGDDNRPALLGPRSPVAPPGVSTGPGEPVRRLPIAPDQSINLTGPNTDVTGVEVKDVPVRPSANQIVGNRFAMPESLPTGLPPEFEKGLAEYTLDQKNSSAKMIAAKQAVQAIPLMQTPGFLSGPLTDQFTKVVAGLKSTGLIDIDENADPTAIRQEVAKKLYGYVSSSPVGQRSDAAQTLKEASSPNPNVQILPALIKLTKDAIALDRVEALMPNTFRGRNYGEYLKYKGTFPQSIDEKALTLDLESEDKAEKIVKSMALKEQSKNARDRAEAAKFFKTLRMAKEQGFY